MSLHYSYSSLIAIVPRTSAAAGGGCMPLCLFMQWSNPSAPRLKSAERGEGVL